MSEHDVQGEVQQPGSIDEFFGVLHDHLHVDCDGLRVDGTLTQRDLEDLALDIFSDCTSLLPEQIIAAAKAVTHDRFLREQSPDASVRHVVDVTTGIAQFTTVHPDAVLALAQRTDVLSRSYDYISRLVAGQTMYRPESRHHKHERRFRTHLLGGFVAHLERLEMPATLLRE
ncbi:MAG TPA: hypothetical protein VJP80_08930, partial [Candidatus Saccharimonadales bacterium]|nr:hypothetical protein [Candidatus Saccharimonadales bacterium]